MEIPSVCPHCDTPYRWELSLAVDQELGGYRCPGCDGEGILQMRPVVDVG